ncbi:MAG: reverse transcriptase domain-containing protein, partial [Bacteroidota bacterium]
CMLLNILSNKTLDDRTPTEVAFGITPDISAFLQFHFYERVLYLDPTESFPKTKEKTGWFVGITDNVGDALTYWVLTEDSGKIIARSDVRPANDDENPNKRAESSSTPKLDPSTESESHGDGGDILVSLAEEAQQPAPIIDPAGLVGIKYVDTFDGVLQQAEVTERLGEDQWLVQFHNGGEERRSYNDLINLTNKTDESGEKLWIFEWILDHKRHSKHKWQVLVLWDTGEETWEPLGPMRESDPVTVARYALEKQLTGLNGWRWAKDYAPDGRVVKLLCRAIKTAQKAARRAPIYKFGHRVPRTTRQAYQFDNDNNTDLWTKAIEDEMSKMREFGTFRELANGEAIPSDYQKVPLHMCFDVKWDGWHKAWLVAGGNWTAPDFQYDFNGTVSSESVRIGLFMAALNRLDVMVGDVSNAYLHAATKEKVYTVAGPEFGKDQGKTMIIEQACYGLRASNAAFGELLSAVLRGLGWLPTRSDPKLWYRDAQDHYEYLATYVDDLMMFSRDPGRRMEEIQKTFELKGVGGPEY